MHSKSSKIFKNSIFKRNFKTSIAVNIEKPLVTLAKFVVLKRNVFQFVSILEVSTPLIYE